MNIDRDIGSYKRGCSGFVIYCVRIRAGFDEKARDLYRRGEVKWCLSSIRLGIDVRAVVEEELDGVDLGGKCARVKRSPDDDIRADLPCKRDGLRIRLDPSF